MNHSFATLYLLLVLGWLASCQTVEETESLPTYQQWHKVTLSFEGPETSEDAKDNPFTNYRLVVTFRNGSQSYEIPGFYAADGNAGESGAAKGNIWQVRFTPDAEGEWSYEASFRKGDNVAVSTDANAGEPVAELPHVLAGRIEGVRCLPFRKRPRTSEGRHRSQ